MWVGGIGGTFKTFMRTRKREDRLSLKYISVRKVIRHSAGRELENPHALGLSRTGRGASSSLILIINLELSTGLDDRRGELAHCSVGAPSSVGTCVQKEPST